MSMIIASAKKTVSKIEFFVFIAIHLYLTIRLEEHPIILAEKVGWDLECISQELGVTNNEEIHLIGHMLVGNTEDQAISTLNLDQSAFTHHRNNIFNLLGNFIKSNHFTSNIQTITTLITYINFRYICAELAFLNVDKHFEQLLGKDREEGLFGNLYQSICISSPTCALNLKLKIIEKIWQTIYQLKTDNVDYYACVTQNSSFNLGILNNLKNEDLEKSIEADGRIFRLVQNKVKELFGNDSETAKNQKFIRYGARPKLYKEVLKKLKFLAHKRYLKMAKLLVFLNELNLTELGNCCFWFCLLRYPKEYMRKNLNQTDTNCAFFNRNFSNNFVLKYNSEVEEKNQIKTERGKGGFEYEKILDYLETIKLVSIQITIH